MTSDRKTANRGIVLVAVLVCLGVGISISLTTLTLSLRARHQLRLQQQQEQTRWLVDAGMALASKQHQSIAGSARESSVIALRLPGVHRSELTIEPTDAASATRESSVHVSARLQASPRLDESSVTQLSRLIRK
ncbi:MAG: hypothetical protein AAGA03_07940 [Planctomycetota bacterium]